MPPDGNTVFGQNRRSDQPVFLAPQPAQQRARLADIGRFADDGAVESQDLVGAEHQRAGMRRRDPQRLQLGQGFRHALERRLFGNERILDRVLVDPGGHDLERHLRLPEQLGADGAAGSQDEARHGLAVLALGEGFIAAAAVSSTERRETSITGQFWLSNSLRVAVISPRTASRST